tara:strand:+ start:633 stop:923 length:291 start_codon:yes stop_codon:yes gene_type:complete
MDDMTLLQLATGPTSSLILLLGLCLGVWRLATNTIIPAVSRWVDVHLSNTEALIESHNRDREAWLESMTACREQGDRIERKVGALFGRLDALQSKQ